MVIAMTAAKQNNVWTPANIVTMARIVLAPFVIAFIYFYAPAWWVLIFGFLAMITDKADGWLARRYGVSDLGTFLDPIADKVMLLGAFAVLVVNGWIWWLPAVAIAIREFAMSSWRSKLAREGISVPARKLAKYKTWFQSFTVAFALVPTVVDHHMWIVTTTLWFSVVITWVSFVQYVIDGSSKVKMRQFSGK
jgi:CDP-diacylglycerol---glycerol-3-phosphate 3-phosphatidyltransferase